MDKSNLVSIVVTEEPPDPIQILTSAPSQWNRISAILPMDSDQCDTIGTDVENGEHNSSNIWKEKSETSMDSSFDSLQLSNHGYNVVCRESQQYQNYQSLPDTEQDNSGLNVSQFLLPPGSMDVTDMDIMSLTKSSIHSESLDSELLLMSETCDNENLDQTEISAEMEDQLLSENTMIMTEVGKVVEETNMGGDFLTNQLGDLFTISKKEDNEMEDKSEIEKLDSNVADEIETETIKREILNEATNMSDNDNTRLSEDTGDFGEDKITKVDGPAEVSVEERDEPHDITEGVETKEFYDMYEAVVEKDNIFHILRDPNETVPGLDTYDPNTDIANPEQYDQQQEQEETQHESEMEPLEMDAKHDSEPPENVTTEEEVKNSKPKTRIYRRRAIEDDDDEENEAELKKLKTDSRYTHTRSRSRSDHHDRDRSHSSHHHYNDRHRPSRHHTSRHRDEERYYQRKDEERRKKCEKEKQQDESSNKSIVIEYNHSSAKELEIQKLSADGEEFMVVDSCSGSDQRSSDSDYSSNDSSDKRDTKSDNELEVTWDTIDAVGEDEVNDELKQDNTDANDSQKSGVETGRAKNTDEKLEDNENSEDTSDDLVVEEQQGVCEGVMTEENETNNGEEMEDLNVEGKNHGPAEEHSDILAKEADEHSDILANEADGIEEDTRDGENDLLDEKGQEEMVMESGPNVEDGTRTSIDSKTSIDEDDESETDVGNSEKDEENVKVVTTAEEVLPKEKESSNNGKAQGSKEAEVVEEIESWPPKPKTVHTVPREDVAEDVKKQGATSEKQILQKSEAPENVKKTVGSTIASELQCPLCNDLYNIPIMLPCAHMLCRDKCAGKLLENSLLICPVCKKEHNIESGLENLPRVQALENIIKHTFAVISANLPASEASMSQTDAAMEYGPAMPPQDLLVGNITPGTKAKEIKELFSKFGKVTTARMVGNPKKPESPIFAQITMENVTEAGEAIKQLHNTEFKGKKIKIKKVKKKEEEKVVPTETEKVAEHTIKRMDSVPDVPAPPLPPKVISKYSERGNASKSVSAKKLRASAALQQANWSSTVAQEVKKTPATISESGTTHIASVTVSKSVYSSTAMPPGVPSPYMRLPAHGPYMSHPRSQGHHYNPNWSMPHPDWCPPPRWGQHPSNWAPHPDYAPPYSGWGPPRSAYDHHHPNWGPQASEWIPPPAMERNIEPRRPPWLKKSTGKKF